MLACAECLGPVFSHFEPIDASLPVHALQFRPNRDIKAVLLHEMIHAYLMLHGIRDDDPGGHGTQFKHLMRAINSSKVADLARPAGGYAITVSAQVPVRGCRSAHALAEQIPCAAVPSSPMTPGDDSRRSGTP